MTFYQNFPRRKSQSTQETCPLCERTYVLGVNGTMDGCDECLGIWRNLDGTVNEVTGYFFDDEDQLTDMEKA